jgi:hydrogenase nickel incorporation protein HypA/HybF
MHEIGIADSILRAVRDEAARHVDAQPSRVCVRIGKLSAVDPDSLRFCFEALTHGTDLAPLALEIELCPRVHGCPRCGTQFFVPDYEFCCPQCGEDKTQFVSGDQLELAYLEMEEHEQSAT